MDELGRQLVEVSTDRILREAEYRAAQAGDPELVIAADPRLQAESGSFATALLEQIHARRSELEEEQAQLNIEHGPNFPSRRRDAPPVGRAGPPEAGRGRQAGRALPRAPGRRPSTASNWRARIWRR